LLSIQIHYRDFILFSPLLLPLLPLLPSLQYPTHSHSQYMKLTAKKYNNKKDERKKSIKIEFYPRETSFIFMRTEPVK